MVVSSKLLGDLFSASESADPTYGADPIDEYRELAMLAHAWEGGALEPPRTAKAVAGRVEDTEGKEPAC